MTTLHLSPVETPAVRRALVGVAEGLEMDAQRRSQRRGDDVHVAELREEIALLRAVDERLAGDQSPAPSRALAHGQLEELGERSDEELQALIGAAEELLDARFLESVRAVGGGQNVAARYCTGAKR